MAGKISQLEAKIREQGNTIAYKQMELDSERQKLSWRNEQVDNLSNLLAEEKKKMYEVYIHHDAEIKRLKEKKK